MNAVVQINMPGQLSSKFAPATPGQSGDLAGGITGGYGLIGYRGKVWSIRYKNNEQQLMRDDGDGPRGSIDVVIIKANPHLSKNWYENGYVEGSNAPPDCSSANGIIPDPNVPKKQSNVCKTCPKNAWGSATGGSGKGKACGDHRRMAVAPLGDLKNEAYGGALLLRCPAASLQDLAAFSQKLEQLGYPYYAVGVKIGFDPQESFPKFTFTAIRPLTDDEADIVLAHQKSPEVQRVISEEMPDEAAIAAAQQAAPPVTADPQVGALPPRSQQTQPVTAPAPVAQTAQVAQNSPAPAAQAQPQTQTAPAATTAPVSGGGFGPTAAVQPTQQTAAQPGTGVQPQTAAQPAPQPPQTAGQVMTGFGPTTAAQPAPDAQPTQQAAQSFPGAADGTKPVEGAANAAFSEDLDKRLAGLLS